MTLHFNKDAWFVWMVGDDDDPVAEVPDEVGKRFVAAAKEFEAAEAEIEPHLREAWERGRGRG